MQLRDKVAVITGGTTGIGLASAQLFAAEGAKVIVTGRQPATLAAARKALEGRAEVEVSDATDAAQLTQLFERVAARHGGIDVVFANAGGSGFRPLEAVDEAFFDEVIALNLKSVYFTILRSAPLLREGASIILNSSITANRAYPATSVYAAAKAGVRSLARSLGSELAARKIRVNVVSPGPIDTPLLGKLGVTDEFRAVLESTNPTKRLGAASEVAALVLYLASDVSAFVNGADFAIDGGAGAF